MMNLDTDGMAEELMGLYMKMMQANVPNLVLPFYTGEDDENPGEMITCTVLATGPMAEEVHEFMRELQMKYAHSTGTVQ